MSEYTDRQLSCVDCNAEFLFSAGQQEFFAQKGFTNDPKRCGPCREAKKASGGGGGGGNRGGRGGGGGPKEMHTAICGDCGTSCQVPFKPSGDRPVYCSSCFGNHKK
jgi:CxxC-x17-CxxC domain-containing protein